MFAAAPDGFATARFQRPRGPAKGLANMPSRCRSDCCSSTLMGPTAHERAPTSRRRPSRVHAAAVNPSGWTVCTHCRSGQVKITAVRGSSLSSASAGVSHRAPDQRSLETLKLDVCGRRRRFAINPDFHVERLTGTFLCRRSVLQHVPRLVISENRYLVPPCQRVALNFEDGFHAVGKMTKAPHTDSLTPPGRRVTLLVSTP